MSQSSKKTDNTDQSDVQLEEAEEMEKETTRETVEETTKDTTKDTTCEDKDDSSEVLPDSESDDEDGIEQEQLDELSPQQLVEKLAQAQSQIAEMKDGYVRAKADVENIQRRSHNEIISARKYAIEGFAQELLSVIDSLDQAAKVEMDQSSGEAVVKMKEGLELTLKQLEKVMEKFGISVVEAEPNGKFDPEIHQAISMVESEEVQSQHIVAVMQKGFKLKDRLLRPAMVVIAN